MWEPKTSHWTILSSALASLDSTASLRSNALGFKVKSKNVQSCPRMYNLAPKISQCENLRPHIGISYLLHWPVLIPQQASGLIYWVSKSSPRMYNLAPMIPQCENQRPHIATSYLPNWKRVWFHDKPQVLGHIGFLTVWSKNVHSVIKRSSADILYSKPKETISTQYWLSLLEHI